MLIVNRLIHILTIQIVASVPALKPFFCRFLPDRYTAAHSRLSRGRMQWQGRSEKRVETTTASASTTSFSSLRSIFFRTRDNTHTENEEYRPPVDLNKPLPTLQRGQEADTQEVVEPARPGTYYSVYDFQADADGYIRVRKASADTPMPEPGMAI